MLQMRWAKPERYDGDTPKGVVVGYPENGQAVNDYFVLQYREVVEVYDDGEVRTATEWKTVEVDQST